MTKFVGAGVTCYQRKPNQNFEDYIINNVVHTTLIAISAGIIFTYFLSVPKEFLLNPLIPCRRETKLHLREQLSPQTTQYFPCYRKRLEYNAHISHKNIQQ